MPDTLTRNGWWSGIRRRAHDHDVERLLWYNRSRSATVAAYVATRSRGRFPELLPEFLKVLLGSMIGFWLIAAALSLFGAQPLYTYAAMGIMFSLQAAHYRRQLARDPDFRVRRCNCAGARRDSTEDVLKSSASTILGMPNSTLAVMLYGGLLALLQAGYAGAALSASILALLVSSYLAWVMITRVRGLCSTCINITALNCLILWQLMP